MKLLTPTLTGPSHEQACPTSPLPLARAGEPLFSALRVSVCFFGHPLDPVALDVLKALHRTDIAHVRLLTQAAELTSTTLWRTGLHQQVVIFDGLHSPCCNVPALVRKLAGHPCIELMVMVRSPEEAQQAAMAGADHALRWPIDLLLFRAVLWGLNAEFKRRPQAANLFSTL